jgi:hypothetical protein
MKVIAAAAAAGVGGGGVGAAAALLPYAVSAEHLERSTTESFLTGIESAAETWSW